MSEFLLLLTVLVLPRFSSMNRSMSEDRVQIELVTPMMTDQQPGPGRRVRMVAPEYSGTDVYHAVYLPANWKTGLKYPVVVEYTGNRFEKCGSTGEVKDANLGYGLTGGRDFIWVTMPYIAENRKKNTDMWWGDHLATVDYCSRNVPRICQQFGGDAHKVFLCGFSRGAIGVSYIGLANDKISRLWAGFLAHDHFDGQRRWKYPGSDRRSALQRLARLQGRPVLVCGDGNDFLHDHKALAAFTFLPVPVADIFDIPEGPVIHPHTDLWMHKDSRYRKTARRWLRLHAQKTPMP